MPTSTLAQTDHKTLHFYFLESVPPAPDLALLAALKTERKRFKLIERCFIYALDGIGRFTLAEKLEKALGVATTARNWRTASKMMEMGTAVTHLTTQKNGGNHVISSISRYHQSQNGQNP